MNANYMIIMLLQAHTIDMGSHHNIFEEILTFILREIQEEPPSSDPPKDTVEEVSLQNNDIAKTVRNVHDIVSDYLRSKQISIEDLVTVTPFWPTMESLNPPVISPLAPIHPHRPCALDFFLHRDELQLIGMSMLTEYVSSIRDGAKMGFSQALTSTDSNDSAEYAPLVTAVEYIFDSTKSTLIPALVKFSYAVLPSNNTNAIPAIADAVLINLAERTSSDEESNSRSISKKSKERKQYTENKSSSSSAIRKSGRATKTPLSSYENRFINKKDPKRKPPLETKKQPRRTSKKKRLNLCIVLMMGMTMRFTLWQNTPLSATPRHLTTLSVRAVIGALTIHLLPSEKILPINQSQHPTKKTLISLQLYYHLHLHRLRLCQSRLLL